MPPLNAETVTRFRPLSELVPAHWREGSIAARDGTRLHWTETGGDGPAVVLLHGAQVGGLTWLRTAQALEARCRVLMPDFRGHGRSGPWGTPPPYTLVTDTRAMLAALDLHEPVVVGHSMGADVAGRLAATEPLRAVVLVEPALRNFAPGMAFDFNRPPPWMQTLFDTLRELKAQTHTERMITGLRLLPPGAPPDWDEADYVAFVDGQARFDLDLYRHLTTDARYLAESPDVIAAIACPILLLTARPMMPDIDIDAGVRAFSDHWRDGRHVHFPDSGHTIAADQFDRFIAALRDFLHRSGVIGRGTSDSTGSQLQ